MNEVLEQIRKIGIVPVVKLDRVEDAVPLAESLINGGQTIRTLVYLV